MQTTPIQLPHRSDLQGLRAIAVMLVFLAHVDFPFFAGGFVGVDVFFVLSGYLITGLLVREYVVTSRIQLWAFWTRRLRRLFPALAFMLLTVFLAAHLVLEPSNAFLQTASLGFAASWTSNLYFALAEFDYFSLVANKDLFLHTWSLGVEEQFYLIWPLLLLLTLAGTAKVRECRARKICMTLLLSIAAIAGASAMWHLPGSNQQLGFYMMPARMFQFAAGALVYLWTSKLQADVTAATLLLEQRFLAPSLAVVGLVLILCSAVIISPHVRYPNATALFPTIGAAFAVLGGANLSDTGLRWLLASRLAVWIGDRSYSIYLWHWPVILFANAYQLLTSPLSVLILACIVVSLAALSYRFIERPIWKGVYASIPPTRVAAYTVMVACSFISISYVAHSARNPPAALQAVTERHLPVSNLPSIYLEGNDCDTSYRSSEVKPCVLAGEAANKTVLLVGDSIGAQWVSVLPEIFSPTHWKSVVITKSACPIVDEDYYYDAVGDIYTVCSSWRAAAIKYIRESSPDVVIIGSSSHYGFSEEQWLGGLSRVLSQLQNSTSHIVLFASTPTVTLADRRCSLASSRLSKFLKLQIPDCTHLIADTSSRVVSSYLELVAANFSNVGVLDLNDLVCPNQQCRTTTEDDVVVFRDDRHLTNQFVLTLVPPIRTRLHELKPTVATITHELQDSGKTGT